MWLSILGSLVRYLLQAYFLPILAGKVHPDALTWLGGPGADRIAAGILAGLVFLWSIRNHIHNRNALALGIMSQPTATPEQVKRLERSLPLKERCARAFEVRGKTWTG